MPRSSIQRLPAVINSNRSRTWSSPSAGSRRRGRPSRPSRNPPTARSAGRRATRRLPLDPDPDPGVGAVGAEPGLDRQAVPDARGEAVADGGRGGDPGVQAEARSAGMRMPPSISTGWPGRRRPASLRGPRRPWRRPARPLATGPARTRGWAGRASSRGGTAVQPRELAGELVVARLHAVDDRLRGMRGHRSRARPSATRRGSRPRRRGAGRARRGSARRPPRDQAKPTAQVVDGRRGGGGQHGLERIG
jgi:hypothetical protein